MRNLMMVVWMGVVAVGPLAGQAPPKKKTAIAKIASKLVDTAVTAAAAGAVDSILGTQGGAAGLGVACPPGTVPSGVGLGMPTAGAAMVAAAKRKLTGKKGEPAAAASAATAAAAAGVPPCVPVGPGTGVDAATAAAAAAQAAAMAGTPSTSSMVGSMAAATPVGLAVAAAPMAGKAAKAVGGLLGGKAQTTESMIKDLAKGRLVLKGIKFIASSDALDDPIDDDVALLAEALSAMEGKYVLNMPAEARDKEAPDTTIARRRLTKVIAALQAAGVSDERVAVVGIYPPGLDPKNKAPKPGDARVELVPVPKDFVTRKP